MLIDRKTNDLELKIEKLEHRFDEGDFETAKEICDKIDFRRMKDARILAMASTVYEKNKEFDTSKDLLKRAYKYSPVQKRLLYDLSYICIEDGDIPEAIIYYKEFCENFPGDSRRELLKYGILKRKNASADQLIRILEDYLTSDLDERWLYELALLYEKADNKENLILCLDKIVEMFGLSEYGKKALTLKQKYESLTEEQKALVSGEMNKRQENNNLFEKNENETYSEKASINEQTEKKDLYTFDEKKEIKHEDITPDNNKDISEEENSDALFNNLPKTNMGLDDTYIQDTDEYFKDDEKGFQSVFSTSHKEIGDQDPLTEEIKLESDNDDYNKEIVDEKNQQEEINKVVEQIKKNQEKLKEENKVEKDSEDSGKKEETDEINDKNLTQEQEDNLNKFKQRKRKCSLNLTEEEKKMNLENIKYHMIVEAMTREQGVEIAKAELGYIRKQMGITKQIAKTNAYNINEKGFDYYKEKIGNNDLIIENAGRLDDRQIDNIEELMINNGNKNIICLIDIMNNFDQMVLRRPAFSERFDIISDVKVPEKVEENIENNIRTNVNEENKKYKNENEENEKINIKEENIDSRNAASQKAKEIETFALMCRNYATSIDCVIPGKSMNALYEKIESMVEKNIPLTKDNAVIVIEEVADKADKQKFSFSKKYDENDCLILKEEHFK